MDKDIHNLQWAQLNDPIVHRVIESGGDATACVVALVEQKKELLKRIMRLEGICPRKVVLPGKEIFIWRCPDDLIPVNDYAVDLPKQIK